MLHIERFTVNMVAENCYIVWDDSREAAVIDCGAFFPEEKEAISRYISEKKLEVKLLLNTHGHFDHVFGADFIHSRYGVGISLSKAEEETYDKAAEQMRQFVGQALPLTPAPKAAFFKDGDTLRIGTTELRVIATPGHTPGGVCFYGEADKVLFSGDSLFRHAIGRCDLPGGDHASLVDALRKRVLTLPGDVRVLPGHGGDTTIEEERASNPFL